MPIADSAPRASGPDPAAQRALRVWTVLARCMATFARAGTLRVADYGLTLPQFSVLEALYHLGPMSLGELADKLLVTGGNITYVVVRLEDQGLLTRGRSPEDGRVVVARLTEAGERKIAELWPDHVRFVEDLVGVISDADQEELRELLKRLGKGIRGKLDALPSP